MTEQANLDKKPKLSPNDLRREIPSWWIFDEAMFVAFYAAYMADRNVDYNSHGHLEVDGQTMTTTFQVIRHLDEISKSTT